MVCAECDRVLRSEQVPQPAPSPEPFPETGKSVIKSDFIKKVAFIIVAIVVLILFASYSNIFGSKYKVTEKLTRSEEFGRLTEDLLLEVTVTTVTTGKPEDLIVVFNGPQPWGTQTKDIDNSHFLKDGSCTVRFLLSDSELKWGHNRRTYLYPPSGSYTLMVKREKDWKVILKKEVKINSSMISQLGLGN
jgi:hypothetical protein